MMLLFPSFLRLPHCGLVQWFGKNVAVTFLLRRKCDRCIRYHFPYIQSGLSLSWYFMWYSSKTSYCYPLTYAFILLKGSNSAISSLQNMWNFCATTSSSTKTSEMQSCSQGFLLPTSFSGSICHWHHFTGCCCCLPNLVNASWLWRIAEEFEKYFDWNIRRTN